MAITLEVQANVIDIRSDTPQQNDIFFVDTNVWFWQTYANASRSHPSASNKIREYSTYLISALSKSATLTYSGLILAELAHIIEKTEREIYNIRSHVQVNSKEYRHNFPVERGKVVLEVQSVWNQVKALAVPVNLTVDEATTDAALNRFKTQAVDGYDLLIIEAISRAGVGQVKIITDDMDYASVPDILVFTSNHNVVQTAIKQKKIMRR